MLVLAVNSGSSSLKCAVLDPARERVHFAALADRLGTPQAQIQVTEPKRCAPQSIPDESHEHAFELMLTQIRSDRELWSAISGVGHRVVHGGEAFTQSVLIDAEVLAAIEACSPLAPLHNPANLLGIVAAQRALPELPHVAVFDTAFHQTMSELAYQYAVPRQWYEQHRIRRYGFHGTSHRYVVQKAASVLGRPLNTLRVITAHLGNGCSATAIDCGRSVDTTMGFTPLEGLVMGTRSGDIDPALIFYLEAQGLSSREIEGALNRKSGLLGLSELTNDMRTLSERYDDHAGARLAIGVFCHRLAKYIAGLSTHFEQLDALVFTGGIGEHSALVRRLVVERLAILGIELDPTLNENHATQIGSPRSRSRVLVLSTNEELMIARDVMALTIHA